MGWEAIREQLQGATVWLAEAGQGQPCDAVDWRGNVALIIGGEAKGAGEAGRALAGDRLTQSRCVPASNRQAASRRRFPSSPRPSSGGLRPPSSAVDWRLGFLPDGGQPSSIQVAPTWGFIPQEGAFGRGQGGIDRKEAGGIPAGEEGPERGPPPGTDRSPEHIPSGPGGEPTEGQGQKGGPFLSRGFSPGEGPGIAFQFFPNLGTGGRDGNARETLFGPN